MKAMDIERRYAMLRLYGRTADPEEVTAVLGLTPSHSQILHYDPEANATAPNGWFLSSEEHEEFETFAQHVEWLLSQLMGKTRELQQLRAAGWKPDVHLGGSSTGVVFFSLSTDAMSTLAGLGLPLSVMIFDGVPDDEHSAPT